MKPKLLCMSILVLGTLNAMDRALQPTDANTTNVFDELDPEDRAMLTRGQGEEKKGVIFSGHRQQIYTEEELHKQKLLQMLKNDFWAGNIVGAQKRLEAGAPVESDIHDITSQPLWTAIELGKKQRDGFIALLVAFGAKLDKKYPNRFHRNVIDKDSISCRDYLEYCKTREARRASKKVTQ